MYYIMLAKLTMAETYSPPKTKLSCEITCSEAVKLKNVRVTRHMYAKVSHTKRSTQVGPYEEGVTRHVHSFTNLEARTPRTIGFFIIMQA
jgi:hypothetical protein